jgi:hypothetical protein
MAKRHMKLLKLEANATRSGTPLVCEIFETTSKVAHATSNRKALVNDCGMQAKIPV